MENKIYVVEMEVEYKNGEKGWVPVTVGIELGRRRKDALREKDVWVEDNPGDKYRVQPYVRLERKKKK